ncbi:MAG: hypothetical protein EOM68_11120 [Spirochaetia bacterium]|nr:hypothetical protein [Spirochaetia bacterium]
MQKENTTATSDKSEKAEQKAQAKGKLKLGKAHVAMLSVSATVLVFILAFSCYGCSYQPITPPTPEEAEVTFESLYNSTWELDTAMGVTALEEMSGIPVERFVIEGKNADNESASTAMFLQGCPPMFVELSYRQGYGFSIESGSQLFAVKILYSASKDGKSETLTMIGNESNTHCYYLKK